MPHHDHHVVGVLGGDGEACPLAADARINVFARLLGVDVLRPNVEGPVARIAGCKIVMSHRAREKFLISRRSFFPRWHVEIVSRKDMMYEPNLIVAGPRVGISGRPVRHGRLKEPRCLTLESESFIVGFLLLG